LKKVKRTSGGYIFAGFGTNQENIISRILKKSLSEEGSDYFQEIKKNKRMLMNFPGNN